jgi:hypothetical protein
MRQWQVRPKKGRLFLYVLVQWKLATRTDCARIDSYKWGGGINQLLVAKKSAEICWRSRQCAHKNVTFTNWRSRNYDFSRTIFTHKNMTFINWRSRNYDFPERLLHTKIWLSQTGDREIAPFANNSKHKNFAKVVVSWLSRMTKKLGTGI